MNTIKVRNIEIGSGTPKIIVPIVGVTKNDIIEEAKTFHSIPVDVSHNADRSRCNIQILLHILRLCKGSLQNRSVPTDSLS